VSSIVNQGVESYQRLVPTGSPPARLGRGIRTSRFYISITYSRVRGDWISWLPLRYLYEKVNIL
jgi:hypothetical protein